MFCPGMLGMAMPYIAEVWVVVRIDDLGRILSFLLRLLVVSFARFLGILASSELEKCERPCARHPYLVQRPGR